MTGCKTFQLIDLDRTLFNTAAFIRAITREVNKMYPGLGAKLDAKVEEAYAREETFFLLRHLRHEQGDAAFESLVRRVIEVNGAEAFILPCAQERIALANSLKAKGCNWGILTYGDKTDQRMKLRIMNLEDAPVYFTRTPNKSEVVQTWQTHDGAFRLPAAFGGGYVDRLILEDDKLRAFTQLPKGVQGIWIKTLAEGEPHPAVPLGTVHVATLCESIEYLKDQFSL